jgi:hypothetical protein
MILVRESNDPVVNTIPTHALPIKTLIVVIGSACVGIVFTSVNKHAW